MIRRILYILFLLTLIGGIAYMYSRYQKGDEQDRSSYVYHAIPSNAGLIFAAESFNNFINEKAFASNVWNIARQFPMLSQSFDKIESLDSLLQQNHELKRILSGAAYAASWHKSGPNSIDHLYSFQFDSEKSCKKLKHFLDANNKLEKLDKDYDGVSFYQLNVLHHHKKLAIFFKDEFVGISENSILLENSIAELEGNGTLKQDANFNKVLNTAGSGTIGNLFIHLTRLNDILSTFEARKTGLSKLSNQLGAWVELDFNIVDNAILLNGFGINKTQQDYYSIIKNQEPVNQNIHKVIPASSNSFVALGLSDIDQFRKQYKDFLHAERKMDAYTDAIDAVVAKTGVNPEAIFDGIIDRELCMVHQSGVAYPDTTDQFLVLKVKSKRNAIKEVEKLLKGKSSSLKKRQIQIDNNNQIASYNFPHGDMMSQLYTPIVNGTNLKRLCFIDNYIVIGPSDKALQSWAKEVLRQQTLKNESNFETFSKAVSTTGNLFYFSRIAHWKNALEASLKPDFHKNQIGTSENWNRFYGLGLQLTTTNNSIYHNLVLHYNPVQESRPKTTWQTKLEANSITKPVFVTNHYNKQKEICVQDELNNLYLINNSGIVIWKKPLKEAIMGTIHQVDLYKNNKLQLLFNTKSAIHLLDRNGNYVDRYPVKFPSPATAPISVFDYEKDKNYRIMVASEDKKIRLYTKDGNLNTGWKFSGSDKDINQEIQFCRVGGKDYIVAKDEARHYILDRRGNTRVKSKQSFSPSVNNEFTLDSKGPFGKPCLVTTASNGTVYFLHFDGTVQKKVLDVSVNSTHYFVYADLNNNGREELVFINDKSIFVYDQASEKRISDYTFKNSIETAPKIYNFGGGTTLIGINDKLNEEIYLLNAQCQNYKGFPLQGNTAFSIGFLTHSDYRFNLLVGGKNGMVMNYKVK